MQIFNGNDSKLKNMATYNIRVILDNKEKIDIGGVSCTGHELDTYLIEIGQKGVKHIITDGAIYYPPHRISKVEVEKIKDLDFGAIIPELIFKAETK